MATRIGKSGGVLAAVLAVALAPCLALADAGERNTGLGSLIREWFGGSTAETTPPRLAIEKSAAAGESGRGILFHGIELGEDSLTRDLRPGATLRLVTPGEAGQSAYFTPRDTGLRIGIASHTTTEGAGSAGRLVQSEASESRSIDLSVSQSVSDFEVTASLGFADYYRRRLNVDSGRSAMLTGLHVGYGGFLIGGGFRFGASERASVAVPRRSWSFGAAYTTESLDLSAAFVAGREGAADALDGGEGLSLAGRYRIVPGVEARASGFYGEHKDRRTSATRDDSMSVIGGIRLSF